MTCEEALILISGHLDQANTDLEAAQLREHLEHCPACRELLAELEENDRYLKKIQMPVPEELCERVMASICAEAEKKPRRRRWTNLAVAAGLMVVIGLGAAMLQKPAAEQDAAAPMMARHGAPAEMAVYEDPAFDSAAGFFYYDHTVILDPQALAEERGGDLVVTHVLLPEMEVCSCETLENGALLYHLETADGAVQLSRSYGVELYQPVEKTDGSVSFALLMP